jgi:mono/diheme cytochrome c family protein
MERSLQGTTGLGVRGPGPRSLTPGPVFLILALLLGAACTRDQWQRLPGPDDAISKVPWFSTMRRGLAIQPYSIPSRPPVPGTVPITGADQELHIENEPDLPLINRLRNPAPRTSESMERGKVLFGIYCYPCHGTTGQGDGPITAKFIQPPNLTAENARKLTDGYVFTLIRYGRGIMPPYGDKVRGIDRWHLVNYLRLLQDTHK